MNAPSQGGNASPPHRSNGADSRRPTLNRGFKSPSWQHKNQNLYVSATGKQFDIADPHNYTRMHTDPLQMNATNAPGPVTKLSLVRRAAGYLAEFRIIPRIETFPGVVSFAQTTPGRITLLAVFGLELRYFFQGWNSTLLVLSFLALITFIPEYRRFVLAITPLAIVIIQTYGNPLQLGLTLGVVASGIFLYWCAMRWPKSRFGQRPIMFLLTGFAVLILSACASAPHTLIYSILWPLVGVVASYVWFIGYALIDRNSKPASDMTLELTAFRPLWGSTNTPFPKGAAYLRRIEARDSGQLAVVQLKALKLLAWAIFLAVFFNLWNGFFHVYLCIPTSDHALTMSVQGTPVAWHLRWESLILGFFESILGISVMGHRIIGICRMAGFNALRNTYRPLSSTTISEFFNRFYYYFKELLVDFFFYPTFLRYWKGHRRLRMVFATFAAVFFGNTFFHFTRDWQIIRHVGLLRAFVNYQASLLYCFILAAAVSISQLRKRGPKSNAILRGHIFPALGVGLFYCLLNVFVTDERGYPFLEYLKYFASLFYVHL